MLTISVDQSADEVFWLDFEGSILYVNDAACRINGYSRDEFLKMTIYDLNPDLTRDIWTRSVTDLRAKKTQLFTTRHRHGNGEVVDVEIMSVYVRQDNKEYSFAFVRDITERKRSEMVLAESERKYRTLFETAEEGIWTIDAGFNTVSANRKMQDLFGYSEQEMLGRPVWDFVPPDEVESMKQALLIPAGRCTRPLRAPLGPERRDDHLVLHLGNTAFFSRWDVHRVVRNVHRHL